MSHLASFLLLPRESLKVGAISGHSISSTFKFGISCEDSSTCSLELSSRPLNLHTSQSRTDELAHKSLETLSLFVERLEQMRILEAWQTGKLRWRGIMRRRLCTKATEGAVAWNKPRLPYCNVAKQGSCVPWSDVIRRCHTVPSHLHNGIIGIITLQLYLVDCEYLLMRVCGGIILDK